MLLRLLAQPSLLERGTKRPFWTALRGAIKEVPKHGQLSVLLNVNACTGRRGGGWLGSENSRGLDAYDRGTRNDNGERQLAFASSHNRLALVSAVFSTPNNATCRTM